jgi:membrane protein DedA with SNARE-associated domain
VVVDGIDAAFNSYGLAAVCLLMLGKAAGIPVPIPGDLILLATAARAAEGKLVLWQAFVWLLVAVVVGGTLQFAVARGPGRGLVYRFGRLAGLGPNRLDAAATAIQQRGKLSLALALLTPGLRNAAVPACGLAGLPLAAFLPPLLAASALDLALHFALGAVGGNLLDVLRPDPFVVASVFVALAALGLAIWLLILRRRSPSRLNREALAAWEATACPVCLALGALSAPAGARLVGAPEEAAAGV